MAEKATAINKKDSKKDNSISPKKGSTIPKGGDKPGGKIKSGKK
jgi:hypothetical protein